jgi:sec-independent protein translocase protein TatC
MTDLVDEFKKRPFSEHLFELLGRLKRIIIFFVIAFGLSTSVSNYLIDVIKKPLEWLKLSTPGIPQPQIISTIPFENFWTFMRVSMVGAGFLMIPILAWEIGGFLSPGLRKIEKKRLAWLVFSFLIVFVVGILLGHRYVLPTVLKLILEFGMDSSSPHWTLSAYVNTSLGVLLVTAIILELPLVMLYSSFWGWVDPKTWSKGRKAALVINSIVSAILSPPDVMSMLIMMIPIQILYESGVWLATLAKWKTKK